MFVAWPALSVATRAFAVSKVTDPTMVFVMPSLAPSPGWQRVSIVESVPFSLGRSQCVDAVPNLAICCADGRDVVLLTCSHVRAFRLGEQAKRLQF
jgi:hypothetical protein